MPNKYFDVDGLATYVHHLGATTLPNAAPDLSCGELLLFLHGAGGNGNTFAGLMQGLADAHSPLAFDFPGHARSGGLDSLGSIDRMADFVGAFAGVLDLRPSVLIGHSMGGAVSIARALANPESVRALVLLGSGARFPVPEERIAQVKRVVSGVERRAFSRDAYSPATSADVVRQGIMEDLKTDPRAAYGDLCACVEVDLESRLADIPVPTLVVVGEDEAPALREQADLMATRIPGAAHVQIPKAGHMLHLEQTDAVAAAVRAFLDGLPA